MEIKPKIVFFLFFVSVLGFKLNLPKQILLQKIHKLQYEGANGQVKYEAHNLPQGVHLQNNTLEIYDDQKVKAGYYPIKIQATDKEGNFDERLTMLVIAKSSQKKISSQKNPETEQNLRVVDLSKVDKVLNGLNISQKFVRKDQHQQRYPDIQFPTEGKSLIQNFLPQKIANYESERSRENRNKLLNQDIQLKSLFQRQLNSAKAIANLLSIIEQAQQSKLKTEEKINQSQYYLKNLLQKQSSIKDKIISAENKLIRIKQGIKASNVQINKLRQSITLTASLKKQKQYQISTRKTGLDNAQNGLKKINYYIKKEEKQLQQYKNSKIKVEENWKNLKKKYEETQKQVEIKKRSSSQFREQIQRQKGILNKEKDIVSQLKEKLSQALAKVMDRENKIQELEKSNYQIKQNIAFLQANLRNINFRIEKSKFQLQQFEKRAQQSEINLDKLKTRKEEIQLEVQKIKQNIIVAQEEVLNIPNEIQKKQALLHENIQNLQYLRQQIFVFEDNLFEDYRSGNDLKQKIYISQENLSLAKMEFNQKNEILNTASKNIEQAQKEKDEIDSQIKNYLKEKVNISFADVPSDKGVEILQQGKYSISSWNEYIERAYGKIDSIFHGQIKTLYSFTSFLGKKQCQIGELHAISGYILQTFSKELIMITQQGEKYRVSFSDCTLALSNVEKYELTPGDIILAKGILDAPLNLNSSQITCLKR